jgi:hypothetical protein
MRLQHAVHRVDVQRQPVPNRQVLGRASQEAGVRMRVDEAGHEHRVGKPLHRYTGLRGLQIRKRTDSGDAAVFHENRATRQHGIRGVHRKQRITGEDERFRRHGMLPSEVGPEKNATLMPAPV